MPGDEPIHESRGRRRSESVDLVEQLVKLHDRISALETDSEQGRANRNSVNESMNKLLTQLSVTVESHEGQMEEFRKAALQIARIAQVLEGAFGQSGLVGQVDGLRKDVSAYNDRLSRVETKLTSLADGVESAPEEKGEGLKSTVINALVKVILALAALLGAAAIGSKFTGHQVDPVAASTVPAAPGAKP